MFYNLLRKFTIGVHKSTNLRILFIKTDQLKDEKSANWIFKHCMDIQEYVWNKRYNTTINTFFLDYLILFADSSIEKIVGYVSASLFDIDTHSVGLNIYEGMILPNYQGQRLLSFSYACLNNKLLDASSAKEIMNIIISGNIYTFGFFETEPYFEKINYSELKGCALNAIVNELSQYYAINDITVDDVLRNAWEKQNACVADLWPEELAKKYHFPLDVKYSQGDVLIKIYLIEFYKNKEWLEDYMLKYGTEQYDIIQ